MPFSRLSPRQRIVTLRAWLAKNNAAWPAELPAPTMCTSRPCVFGASLRAAPYEMPLPDEPVETLDRQVTPRHATREHDRARPQDLAAVELQLSTFRIDAS